ncbi:cytochrome c biogenesis CcdA family protein [Oceanibium sediminis]|uniref:cytochrome c biogenesis CcdA family protein n=1 Tax=Oceanibium sediminis TaxID=2026339 RepID=UPI000DD30593|nr:cytochrome c biogenesis protein CcdA [Oceanibium sediminis]
MFGIDVIDSSLLPALFVALFAGVLSFLSPCVLPIVPPYLAYMAGTTVPDVQTRRGADPKVVTAALFFVLGLSTVFIFLGFAASMAGQALLQYQREMAIASGIVILVFGLHFLHVFRIPLLDREARLDARDGTGTAMGAYVMGLAFAFGWTPCIGPVLGMILSLAAQEDTVGRGVVMMASYAIGLGLPFLLAAIFLNRALGAMGRLRAHMGTIERVTGVMLLVVGGMLVTGLFSTFSYWLLETFPALGLIG